MMRRIVRSTRDDLAWITVYIRTSDVVGVTRLLGAGVDVNSRVEDGPTAPLGITLLHLACLCGRSGGLQSDAKSHPGNAVVDLLIEAKADVDARQKGPPNCNERPTTKSEEIALWLSRQADELTYSGISKGSTPLHFAASKGSVYVAKRLVAAGAKRIFENARGKTALDVAERIGWSAMFTTLKVGNYMNLCCLPEDMKVPMYPGRSLADVLRREKTVEKTSNCFEAELCCRHCGATSSKLKMCTRCDAQGLSVLYCNTQCQTADWASHRQDCGFRIVKTKPDTLRKIRLLSEDARFLHWTHSRAVSACDDLVNGNSNLIDADCEHMTAWSSGLRSLAASRVQTYSIVRRLRPGEFGYLPHYDGRVHFGVFERAL